VRPPASPLAKAACVIALFSVGACIVAMLFTMIGLRTDVPGAIAMLSLALCLIGGVPLAIGALADRGFGKRLAWVALAANLLLPLLVFLTLFIVIRVWWRGEI